MSTDCRFVAGVEVTYRGKYIKMICRKLPREPTYNDQDSMMTGPSDDSIYLQ